MSRSKIRLLVTRIFILCWVIVMNLKTQTHLFFFLRGEMDLTTNQSTTTNVITASYNTRADFHKWWKINANLPGKFLASLEDKAISRGIPHQSSMCNKIRVFLIKNPNMWTIFCMLNLAIFVCLHSDSQMKISRKSRFQNLVFNWEDLPDLTPFWKPCYWYAER